MDDLRMELVLSCSLPAFEDASVMMEASSFGGDSGRGLLCSWGRVYVGGVL